MKKNILLTFLVFITTVTNLLAQDDSGPAAFISISGTLGRHTVNFKNFAKSPGFSFGFSVSAGIYAINNEDYRGGIQITLLEGASRNEERRTTSEGFIPPHDEFDKHIIFKFAQFRSATIGWFSEFDTSDSSTIYHQLGFGIFGTTESDQLLDFGMSNQLGILTGDADNFRGRFGLNYDTTFGTGNPNYTQNNIGFTFGGFRSF